jgi:hypothetical protein
MMPEPSRRSISNERTTCCWGARHKYGTGTARQSTRRRYGATGGSPHARQRQRRLQELGNHLWHLQSNTSKRRRPFKRCNRPNADRKKKARIRNTASSQPRSTGAARRTTQQREQSVQNISAQHFATKTYRTKTTWCCYFSSAPDIFVVVQYHEECRSMSM